LEVSAEQCSTGRCQRDNVLQAGVSRTRSTGRCQWDNFLQAGVSGRTFYRQVSAGHSSAGRVSETVLQTNVSGTQFNRQVSVVPSLQAAVSGTQFNRQVSAVHSLQAGVRRVTVLQVGLAEQSRQQVRRNARKFKSNCYMMSWDDFKYVKRKFKSKSGFLTPTIKCV